MIILHALFLMLLTISIAYGYIMLCWHQLGGGLPKSGCHKYKSTKAVSK